MSVEDREFTCRVRWPWRTLIWVILSGTVMIGFSERIRVPRGSSLVANRPLPRPETSRTVHMGLASWVSMMVSLVLFSLMAKARLWKTRGRTELVL